MVCDGRDRLRAASGLRQHRYGRSAQVADVQGGGLVEPWQGDAPNNGLRRLLPESGEVPLLEGAIGLRRQDQQRPALHTIQHAPERSRAGIVTIALYRPPRALLPCLSVIALPS